MGPSGRLLTFAACCAWALVEVLVGAQGPQPSVPSQSAQTVTRCRVEGHVRSGNVPLPGASVVVQVGDAVKAATSTDVDGKYTIAFSPNATYHLSADLTSFARVERDVALAAPPCDTTVDFVLMLKPRGDLLAAAAKTPAGQGGQGGQGTQTQGDQAAPGGQAAQAPSAGQPIPGQRPGAPDQPPQSQPTRAGRGRGAQGGPGSPRFQTLNVEADANGAATLDAASPEDAADIAGLLPAGFSAQTAQADAIAINGSADATSLDRGLLNARQQAPRGGAFDAATGQFADSGLPAAQGPGGLGGQGDGGGRGGRGGGAGGRGGGRGFNLGGRAARAQSPYQGSVTYTFGGSALNAVPYQLRPDVPTTQPLYAANTFGGTLGGPLKIPGLYADTKGRTNFQLNYTGNESNNVFDQYATVPTDAMRQGNFSGSSIPLIDPATGQPFAGNQIPASRINPGAAALLAFIPAPNLPGIKQNYHVSTTAHSASEAISARLIHNFSPTLTPGGRGGFGRGGGGFGGGGGGVGGRGGPGGRGTNIVLNAQLQYRRNETESPSIFTNLGSQTINTSIAAPVSLNILKGRTIHNVTVSFTHANVQTTNALSGVEDVAGAAGIKYPGLAAADPLNWGVPNLSFTNFSSVRMPAASLRTDDRLTLSYVWRHPTPKHQLRLGGDYRLDNSIAQINSNARGSYTFTGLYSSGGAPVAGPTTGADFADFLVGVPQLATYQHGGLSHLRQHAFDAYVEDNWQKSAKLTLNLGLRYELWLPFTELNGRMSNLSLLNASSLTGANFTGVVPVLPGQSGIPAGVLHTDGNNLGPRLGFAYRVAKNTTLRGGYSITYNSASYASIARELTAQPPFAETETVTGTSAVPLMLEDALLTSTAGTTNNWGVDPNYALGTIQMWNAAVTRNLTPNWAVTASYTGTKGTNLDLLNAPNRGPLGLLIPDVQPFTFESSGGRSMLNAASFQVRRRLAGGVSGGATYTLEKSMDDVSSLGAGGAVVAQNPRNLGAEWAVSNFDRRNQLSADLGMELPFGPNRHWLKNGGVLAGIVGEWTLTLALTLQTGTPLTAHIVGAATDVAQGVNGALRANYTGAPIQVSNPLVDEFFNTAAFAVPAPGEFGDTARNMIIGPGVRQLNGGLTRDVRIGGTRSVTLGINALNLLNTVQWQSIDTNVNSPTFGQVLSARPMRTMTASIRVRF